MNKELIVYFHRDGKPGVKLNLNPEKKKKLTLELRDENIRSAEERGREDLVENFKESIELNLTPSEIRKKLKGGKHAKKENR